jgi:hypothetical protein
MNVSFQSPDFSRSPKPQFIPMAFRRTKPRAGTGPEEIAQSTFSTASGEFACKIQPYSATVMVLSPIRGN